MKSTKTLRVGILKTILLITALFSSVSSTAIDHKLFAELDEAISQRPQFLQQKEKQIADIKAKIAKEHQPLSLLRLYKQIADQYYVYQYDSAMCYVRKGLALAEQTGNQQYITLNTITLAELLTLTGLYNEANNKLDSLPEPASDHSECIRYRLARFTLYNNWADYCGDDIYKPKYQAKSKQYLQSVYSLLKGTEPNYDFLMGEYHAYITEDKKASLSFYINALNNAQKNSRSYAMAAFAIANNYSASGNYEKYVDYLVKSAISDVTSTIKENLSLQYLASYLYEHDREELERAERYIKASVEDAYFYNNRLRLLEIAKVMPRITETYQATIKSQNQRMKYLTIGILALLAAILINLYFIFKKNKQLHSQQKEISENNDYLRNMTKQLGEMNDKLSEANKGLSDTNHHREALVKIFINLCTKYIDRMKNYQKLVKRKIKANQTSELLSTLSSTRISEEDAQLFLGNFDKAFLNLYPNFVDELNTLLQPDTQLKLSMPNSLSPELRIYALIRLGVKDSSEIANLLFYSPQTIYNYRSALKNKALNKDTFDNDVLQLCTVVRS